MARDRSKERRSRWWCESCFRTVEQNRRPFNGGPIPDGPSLCLSCEELGFEPQVFTHILRKAVNHIGICQQCRQRKPFCVWDRALGSSVDIGTSKNAKDKRAVTTRERACELLWSSYAICDGCMGNNWEYRQCGYGYGPPSQWEIESLAEGVKRLGIMQEEIEFGMLAAIKEREPYSEPPASDVFKPQSTRYVPTCSKGQLSERVKLLAARAEAGRRDGRFYDLFVDGDFVHVDGPTDQTGARQWAFDNGYRNHRPISPERTESFLRMRLELVG